MSDDEISCITPLPDGADAYTEQGTYSAGYRSNTSIPFTFQNRFYDIGKNKNWKTHLIGMTRLGVADRLIPLPGLVYYERRLSDFPVSAFTNLWLDTQDRLSKRYVVETIPRVIERCLLMATDPGDLVLDPTCGSGTTACVAEQWGRRWITIDTSRVALALARARIMGARYPYYLLADSPEGLKKEADVTRTIPPQKSTYNNIRQGFVYERVPHITLKSIANNTEIDVIWEKFQLVLEPLREKLNTALGQNWEEWEIPREPVDPWPKKAAEYFWMIKNLESEGDKIQAISKLNKEIGRTYTLKDLPERPEDSWTDQAAISAHKDWWENRIARQKEIDASIAAKADVEYLYDKPYEDRKKVRVAGPFTVESLSPHRVLGVDADDELIDPLGQAQPGAGDSRDFARMILENLKTSGVQQAHKEDKISFTSLVPWPGNYICAEGRYERKSEEGSGKRERKSEEGSEKSEKDPSPFTLHSSPFNPHSSEKRAAVFIGPEFGTVSRPDLVAATREAGDAGFDVLIACAFSYDAHSSEFNKLGRIPVLKARMNADLHMGDDLKNTGKGNLFVIFGEPDIDILEAGEGKVQVKINGVDVFHPQTGEVRSDGAEGIACWFIDTDYNEESFFVRHAYFLGANDPYKALKTTLKAEINEDAWESLHSDISRPFEKPESGRIAVKVINHLGDEVMKVFRV
jgi:adenine-specific DNA-methyltransferase